MDIMITSKNNENFFVNKNIITLGTKENCNHKLELDYDIFLTIQYDFSLKNYVIVNNFSNPNILFCREPLKKLELGQFNRLFFKNSKEFLTVRILDRISA